MGDQKFAYQPALDGVRAVSVAAVLAFHLGLAGMTGGYLGVSMFFTLSGFLITSLLLGELTMSGRVDVRAFYVRRLRRLLPASLLCLGGVAVLAGAGLLAERASLRSDLLGALSQLANWDALLSEQSYADLFVAPSPVAHFWSLAIEEQFYLVWPAAIACLAALAARRGRPGRLATPLTVAFIVFAVSAPLTARWWSADAAYFASWARFAEILAGAALAAVLARRTVPARTAWLAPVCLAATVVLFVVTPAGRGWAYAGGLPLFALVTAGLIAGLQVDGPVRTMLAWRPAVWVGRVSYGLYLFHWPVFSVLDEQRTGLTGPALIAARLGVTVAISAVSYRLIERPVRTRRVLPRTPVYLGGMAAGMATVVVAALVLVPAVDRPAADTGPTVIAAPASSRPVVARRAGPSVQLADGPRSASASPAVSRSSRPREKTTATPVPAATRTAVSPERRFDDAGTAPAQPRPLTVAVFGDSVPDWLLRDAAGSYSRTDIVLVDAAHEGCDGARGAPPMRERHGGVLPPKEGCQDWLASYPKVVENARLPVDAALLVLGQAPMVDRLVAGAWVSPCVDMRWYTADVVARIRYLRAHVDNVVVAVPSWGGEGSTWILADDHLMRMGCVRRELLAVARRLHVATVDLAARLCPAGPAGECSDLRERDGVHVDPEDAPRVLDWVLDRLLRVTRA